MIRIYLDSKVMDVGDKFYDFKALSQDGDSITFSNLMDKYILFEFTASSIVPPANKQQKNLD